MELIRWANSKGQTLTIAKEDFETIQAAMVEAFNSRSQSSGTYTQGDGCQLEIKIDE